MTIYQSPGMAVQASYDPLDGSLIVYGTNDGSQFPTGTVNLAVEWPGKQASLGVSCGADAGFSGGALYSLPAITVLALDSTGHTLGMAYLVQS